MKIFFFILLLAFLSIFISNAQDQVRKETKVKPGLCFSTFGNYGVYTGFRNEQDPEYSSNSFYSSGLSFFFMTNKMVEIESGIYYSYHSINIDQTYPGHHNYVRKREKIELIEIPVNVRFDFPYFYVSTGLLFDFEINNSPIIDKQTGIGFNTGFGVSYKFKKGILVYAGPIYHMHTIYPWDHDKLSGLSLKIGVAF